MRWIIGAAILFVAATPQATRAADARPRPQAAAFIEPRAIQVSQATQATQGCRARKVAAGQRLVRHQAALPERARQALTRAVPKGP